MKENSIFNINKNISLPYYIPVIWSSVQNATEPYITHEQYVVYVITKVSLSQKKKKGTRENPVEVPVFTCVSIDVYS